MAGKKNILIIDALKTGINYFFEYILTPILVSLPFVLIFLPIFMYAGAMSNPIWFVSGWGLLIIPVLASAIFLQNYVMIKAISEKNNDFEVENIALMAMKKIPGVILMSCIITAGMVVGLVLLIIPGIIIAFLWDFWLIIYLKKGGVLKSLEETVTMIKPYFFKFLGLCLLWLFVVYLPILIISFIVSKNNPLIGQLIAQVGLVSGFLLKMWMFSLYNAIGKASGFKHSKDRKAGKSVTKILVIIVILLTGLLFTFPITNLIFRFADHASKGVTYSVKGNIMNIYKHGIVRHTTLLYYDRIVEIKYYPDGEKLSETVKINGLPEGDSKEYYKSGKVRLKKTYVKGLQEGKEIEYTEDGKVLEAYEFKAGKAIKDITEQEKKANLDDLK